MELRPIPNHPDYFAGADGSIWSAKSGLRKLSAFDRGRGYLAVNLCHDGKYRMHSVHVLVAETWIGPRPTPQHLVMHANDDPADNTDKNLAWGLPAENSADMTRKGRQARGERVGGARLTAAQVADIRKRLASGESRSSVRADFGITAPHIHDIATRRNWRHI